MKMIYYKNEQFPMNMSEHDYISIAEIFGCPIYNFPIKYLGVPLHF